MHGFSQHCIQNWPYLIQFCQAFVHSFLEDVGKERNVTNITCRIHEIMFLIMLFMLFKFGSTMAQKSQRRSVFFSSNLKAVLSPLVLSFHFKHTFSHQFLFKKKLFISAYIFQISYINLQNIKKKYLLIIFEDDNN